MVFNRVTTKVTIVILLIYWLSQFGGRRLIPIYLLVVLFYILSLKYRFIANQELIETLGIFGVGLVVRVVTILVNPNPPIDVLPLCSQAIDYLLQGVNPYTVTYSIPPELIMYPNLLGGCPYPPLMLWLLMPGHVLFQDLRFSILVADLFVGFLLYMFSDDKNLGAFMATLYILNPLGTQILKFAWNESILALFLLLTLFYWKNGKKDISCVFLGLSLGIKQFAIVFTPFMWKNYTKKQILVSILVGIFTYMPYLTLSPYDLLYDIFLYFNYVRYDSKSLIPFILRFFWDDSTTIPSNVRTILSILQYSVVGSLILKLLNHSTTAEKIAYNFSLSLFIFILLSPVSNINYFYILLPFFALGAKEFMKTEGEEATFSLKHCLSDLIKKITDKKIKQ